MVKLPGKFDDICKTSKSVLDDDYKAKGYQLEAKQKTNLDGAVLTASVDLDETKKSDVFTPTKLSWKFPKPFGIVGFAIDKFEYDKGGNMKVETSMSKAMHKIDGLTIDAKSDCKDPKKATMGLSFTGIKDAFVKFETTPMDVMNFKAECLYGVGPVAVGAQFAGTDLKKANVGINFTQGNFFASLIAKKQLSEFMGHVYFKPCSDCMLAATCTSGDKVTYAVGGQGTLAKGVVAKAKIDSKKDVQATCKFEIAKGLKATLGGLYNIDSGSSSLGAKLAIE